MAITVTKIIRIITLCVCVVILFLFSFAEYPVTLIY